MKLLKIIKYLIFLIAVILILINEGYQFQNKVSQSIKIKEYDMNYIKIPAVSIYNLLIDGINDNHLNMNVATIEFQDNIIVAGHAIKSVFQNLKNIHENDEIELYYNQIIYHYKVEEIRIINVNEFKKFDEHDKLILITCIDLNNRLIVIAKQDIK